MDQLDSQLLSSYYAQADDEEEVNTTPKTCKQRVIQYIKGIPWKKISYNALSATVNFCILTMFSWIVNPVKDTSPINIYLPNGTLVEITKDRI